MINAYIHPYCYIARVQGVLFQFWRTEIPLEAAKAAKAVADLIVEEGIQPFALYIENAPKTKPPEAEARKILTELGLRAEGCRACSFIVGGTGFISATNRAVMSSMTMLASTDYPIHVSKSPEAGLNWLANYVEQDEAQLLSIRARMVRAWEVGLQMQVEESPDADEDAPAVEGPPFRRKRELPKSLKEAFAPREGS